MPSLQDGKLSGKNRDRRSAVSICNTMSGEVGSPRIRAFQPRYLYDLPLEPERTSSPLRKAAQQIEILESRNQRLEEELRVTRDQMSDLVQEITHANTLILHRERELDDEMELTRSRRDEFAQTDRYVQVRSLPRWANSSFFTEFGELSLFHAFKSEGNPS